MDLEGAMKQFSIIKIHKVHVSVGYKIYYSSHRLYTRRHWNISRDIKQGAKISHSKGIEIIESVHLSLWNYVRN